MKPVGLDGQLVYEEIHSSPFIQHCSLETIYSCLIYSLLGQFVPSLYNSF